MNPGGKNREGRQILLDLTHPPPWSGGDRAKTSI